ncbi:alpha/beta hydrolase [Actinoplanes sp. TBRC 11911]|uniref:alpha/beta hydrolase fold domain-containing protein n=1 Tax=Actinoplanes sp. TBRC 11911 TaxID=2729386 RepID=UPI00145FC301|nr:alpha/beta hydrolase fold domain-containing protein [Actinoplanes sp. TBRC 11911]NMO56839.1 alpha/beta hydrolase [Actinoplanes sp. TBRC 11911]
MSGFVDMRTHVIAAAGADTTLPALILDNAARRIADETDVAVITVDYRLAPENPYPAALEDYYAVLRWASDTVAVLGEGAGGGHTVATAVSSRDRSGPPVAALLLDARPPSTTAATRARSES